MKDLLSLLIPFNPKELSNGEIRTKCLHEENHTDGSGNMSMFLSQDKNAYHCFSCGAKGTLSSLLVSKFSISLFEAIEYINLSTFEYASYEDEKEEKKSSELEGYELPKVPHKSMLSRGFSLDTLKHFKVGFYKSEDKLVHTVPLYKGRKLRGVKFRQDKPNRTFWYSEGFDRKSYIYNEPRDKEEIILVEGESDVWRSYDNKIPASATLGTQVNKEQLTILCRFNRVILALDNDFPGSVATEKIYKAIKDHTEVLFMPYDATDPGECSRENWEIAYNSCSDYLTYNLAMHEHLDEDYDKILEQVNFK